MSDFFFGGINGKKRIFGHDAKKLTIQNWDLIYKV